MSPPTEREEQSSIRSQPPAMATRAEEGLKAAISRKWVLSWGSDMMVW